MPTSLTNAVSSKVEVVLVGHFTPNDALPEKLADSGVISKNEANTAQFRNLLKDQIVEFDLEWGTLQVLDRRIVAHSQKAPYVRVADLLLKMTKEVMPSPTVTMMGINREFTFSFPSLQARDDFGTRIVPPTAWGPWGATIAQDIANYQDQKRNRSGLVTVTMRQTLENDREEGWIDVQVAATPPDVSKYGVSIRVNDHYQPHESRDPQELSPDGHAASRTVRLLDLLLRNFDDSVARSEAIVKGLVQQQ